MMAATGQKPKAVHSTHSLISRMERAEFRVITSQRMLAARELNGFAQTEAATRMGYKNPTQLSLWEMGRRQVPVQKLVLASEVYRVSMDYLCGISPEPDRDPQSAAQLRVLDASREMIEGMSRTLADAVMSQAKLGGPTVEASVVIVAEGERLVGAFKRFIELNAKRFDDMRGGATLKSFMDSFEANGLNVAREMIERHKRIGPHATRIALKKLRHGDPRTQHLFAHIDA